MLAQTYTRSRGSARDADARRDEQGRGVAFGPGVRHQPDSRPGAPEAASGDTLATEASDRLRCTARSTSIRSRNVGRRFMIRNRENVANSGERRFIGAARLHRRLT
jgi:hypothetical protein